MRVNHHTWISPAYLTDGSICESPGSGRQFVISLHIPVGANGCVPRTDVTVNHEAKLENACRVLQEGDPSKGISQRRVWSSWMLLDKQWLGQRDSCSRSQGNHIKDWQTCFSHWPDNGLYVRNKEITSLLLSLLSASGSAQLCNISWFLLTGAVSSHIVNILLLLLGCQIIIC